MSQKSASDFYKGKKVGYNLHHFSWFEAPIPRGFICLAGAFIFVARQLHGRIWTAYRGIETLAPQDSPEQNDEAMKLIFDALRQLCAPTDLYPNLCTPSLTSVYSPTGLSE